ncbi:hypothetical protein C8J57DRAFT_1503641 [Mycena rebaudengoi]|nr:hypothetical protein C8J57DRAFT_1503641 [Mycena rebaudengoi]
MAMYHNIVADVARNISPLTGNACVDIYRPAPEVEQTSDWGRNKELAFHIVALDPLALSWVVGLWAALSSTADVESLVHSLCAAQFLLISTNSDIVTYIVQITQGVLVGTATQCALVVAASVDVQFIPHNTDPLYLVYLQPCTADAGHWEGLKKLIHPHLLTYHMARFSPRMASTPPLNVLGASMILTSCMSAPSPVLGESPPAPPHEWWGPPDQLSRIADGMGLIVEEAMEVEVIVVVVKGDAAAVVDAPESVVAIPPLLVAVRLTAVVIAIVVTVIAVIVIIAAIVTIAVVVVAMQVPHLHTPPTTHPS